MELVLDANVLVAAFLRSATTRELLLDERLTFYAPEYSVVETEKVLGAPRLRQRLGRLSAVQMKTALAQLMTRVRVIPEAEYASHLMAAVEFAPHVEDAPYLALAMHLRIPLWSNDTELKTQDAVLVYTTTEMLEFLQRT